MRAGDRDLVTADDLFAVLADVDAGSELTITLVRGAEELTVTGDLAGSPPPTVAVNAIV